MCKMLVVVATFTSITKMIIIVKKVVSQAAIDICRCNMYLDSKPFVFILQGHIYCRRKKFILLYFILGHNFFHKFCKKTLKTEKLTQLCASLYIFIYVCIYIYIYNIYICLYKIYRYNKVWVFIYISIC